MPTNVVDLVKLKDKMSSLSKNAKLFRVAVKKQLAEKEAQEAEPFDTSLPSQSTSGDTLPQG